jgi:hypothetical protein
VLSSVAAHAAGLRIEQAAIKNGQLLIIGRTEKPNQVVAIVGSEYRTASLPSRRFRFEVPYLPPTCQITLKAEVETLDNYIVTGCAPRGKDGVIGHDGKDGKDGKDGFSYESLQGDRTTFKCWPSDIIGLWFIRDYPAPNSRTIAHIVPDRIDGGNKLKLSPSRRSR